MKIKCVLDENAILPVRAHDIDVGFDLFSRNGAVIWPGYPVTFDTGVHLQLPPGYAGEVDAKSSLMEQNLLTAGIVDPGYTGSIKVRLFNLGTKIVTIEPKQKIAQLVIKSVITPEIDLAVELEETERGDGGFGSTGKF